MFWHLLLVLLSPLWTLYLCLLRDHRDREILALRQQVLILQRRLAPILNLQIADHVKSTCRLVLGPYGLAKRARIDKQVTPHVLRHTYATRLLDQGFTIREVQELLGHSNVATTQIYTHVNPGSLREKVQGGRRDEVAEKIAALEQQLAKLKTLAGR